MIDEKTGGWNKTGIALAVLSIAELHTRKSFTKYSRVTRAANLQVPLFNWLAASFALGSLQFFLLSLLSDSGTLVAWSWTGYEQRRPRGPLPGVHGYLTLIAQAAGILLSICVTPRTFLAHPLWFTYGCISAFVMHTFRVWLGFVGGLNFAVFLMSILPSVFAQAANTGGPSKVYFTASIVVILLNVASIWTVAYAFVPGGIYLRERTDM